MEVLEQHDTDGIADWAVVRIPGEIVANQSVNVDSFSGATLTSSILSTAEYLESAKSESDLSYDLMSGCVVKYDSMEAGMEACGMPNLPETLAAHDPANASGYYFSPARAALYSTYGSISVDDVCHVLTEADEPIPHLYAMGEVIGSKDYQVNSFYIGQLGQALTMAALAVDEITNLLPFRQLLEGGHEQFCLLQAVLSVSSLGIHRL